MLDAFFFLVVDAVVGTENITFIHLIDCIEIVGLKKGCYIQHHENSKGKRLVQLVYNAPPDAAQLTRKPQLGKVCWKQSENTIQKFQICHVIDATKLGSAQFLDDVEEDVRNAWMEEEAFIPLSGSAVNTVIQAPRRLVLVQLGVGMYIIKIKSRLLTEIFAANKGFPLVRYAPTMLPQ